MVSDLKGWIRSSSSRLAQVAARAYVVGPELSDALASSRRSAADGLSTSICYWNADGDSPEQVAAACVRAVDAIAAEMPDAYLSIKAPALKFDRQALAPIVERAREKQVRLHFDALAPEAADETFAMIEDSLSRHPDFGCTLPARWERSLRDAELAVDRGLHVRVVKGQWVDPAHPDLDLRAGYLAVIDRLAGRARHVAVATHDPDLAREALQRLRKAGTACELELLFGLPMRAPRKVAAELGVKTRVYLPYGHGWLPYVFSQVRKNPRMLGWLVRDLVQSVCAPQSGS
jgi:proline dehydrogenase